MHARMCQQGRPRYCIDLRPAGQEARVAIQLCLLHTVLAFISATTCLLAQCWVSFTFMTLKFPPFEFVTERDRIVIVNQSYLNLSKILAMDEKMLLYTG